MSKTSSNVTIPQPAWRSMLRVFRIALDPRKLALGALGLVLVWLGDWLLAKSPLEATTAMAPPWTLATPPAWFIEYDSYGTMIEYWATHVGELMGRLLSPIAPLLGIAWLPFEPDHSWASLGERWTRFFWSLLVWSLCGGAIARLAAIEFSKHERSSLWTGVRYAAARIISLFSAPLLPILAILALWGLLAVGGLVMGIPYVGEVLIALLWGFGLLIGLGVVLIVIATIAGWPLMVAGIGTENSDAFDGFSRSFSYLYGRPWLAAWCVAIALCLGSGLSFIVEQVTYGISIATVRAASTFHNSTLLSHAAPQAGTDYHVVLNGLTVTYRPRSEESQSPVAELILSGWRGALFTLANGFAVSFFWCAATVIYFILRRADDATHFDEIWLNDPPEEEDLMPLSGIAATDQPVVERSHHPTVGESPEE